MAADLAWELHSLAVEWSSGVVECARLHLQPDNTITITHHHLSLSVVIKVDMIGPAHSDHSTYDGQLMLCWAGWPCSPAW